MCLDMRFERTALYAYEYGFPMMTSSLGISRWKNVAQIDESGAKAVAPHDGLTYWDLPILSNTDPCEIAPTLAW
jgi:predicted adenine nucleotide alpha hydrolase (AANH) superfamily ATPase